MATFVEPAAWRQADLDRLGDDTPSPSATACATTVPAAPPPAAASAAFGAKPPACIEFPELVTTA
jgi:hypothetical protein